jgi:hypothetical protein
MMRALRWAGVLLLVLAATVIGTNFGWRWVLAPLLGFAILSWLLASLRVLVHGGRNADEPLDDDPDDSAHTMFWCDECGTELLLVVRGTRRPPSHCGQRMHERTELIP